MRFADGWRNFPNNCLQNAAQFLGVSNRKRPRDSDLMDDASTRPSPVGSQVPATPAVSGARTQAPTTLPAPGSAAVRPQSHFMRKLERQRQHLSGCQAATQAPQVQMQQEAQHPSHQQKQHLPPGLHDRSAVKHELHGRSVSQNPLHGSAARDQHPTGDGPRQQIAPVARHALRNLQPQLADAAVCRTPQYCAPTIGNAAEVKAPTPARSVPPVSAVQLRAATITRTPVKVQLHTSYWHKLVLR